MKRYRAFPVIFLFCLLPLLNGCLVTAVGLAGAGVATAVQSSEEIVEASYPHPYWCVFKATHVALKEMSIPLERIDQTEGGDTFFASTAEYPIRVELHQVTDQVVRVTVYAGENIFQQDQATAEALIDTIQQVIDRSITAYQ